MVLYLGVSGVLHPSPRVYHFARGVLPWLDGHDEYEGAPLLLHVLRGFPAVRIVLSSRHVWSESADSVARQLGPDLCERLLGHLLDEPAVRRAAAVSGGGSKCRLIRADLQVRQPADWVALDDDDRDWSEQERSHHVVLTDALRGLLEPAAPARLQMLLASRTA